MRKCRCLLYRIHTTKSIIPLSCMSKAFSRSSLMGCFALKHSLWTFEGVSSPERVVRSMQVTAFSSQAAYKGSKTKNTVIQFMLPKTNWLRRCRNWMPGSHSKNEEKYGIQHGGYAKNGLWQTWSADSCSRLDQYLRVQKGSGIKSLISQNQRIKFQFFLQKLTTKWDSARIRQTLLPGQKASCKK